MTKRQKEYWGAVKYAQEKGVEIETPKGLFNSVGYAIKSEVDSKLAEIEAKKTSSDEQTLDAITARKKGVHSVEEVLGKEEDND